ncbi:MAG TPA: hypothetical protein VFQ35_13405 [Polyangiaceae bacterium]|nr:hypothetical protein [Polyangiaceae bacterium]
MSVSVPPLAEFLRWLAEMPPVFHAEPEGFVEGSVRTRAVVADLFETLFGEAPNDSVLAGLDATDTGKTERNRLRWILAAAHLVWHPSFRSAPPARGALEKLFFQELPSLAGTVDVAQLAHDSERREELIRRTLRLFERRLPGETENEASDRLKQVDSIERRRVLLAAADRERRAREVREAMARKAAEEAAAKVSRE